MASTINTKSRPAPPLALTAKSTARTKCAPRIKSTTRTTTTLHTKSTPNTTKTVATTTPPSTTRISKPARRRPLKTHPKVLGPLATSYATASLHQSSSRLLSLPPEIRNLIWTQALTSSDGTLRYNTSESRFEGQDVALSLPATCHQVALETQYLAVKVNKLVFEDAEGYLRWRKRLSGVEAGTGWKVRVGCVELAQGNEV